MVTAVAYPVLQPVVTDSSLSPPRARDRILRLLEVSPTHLQPKIISLRTGLKHNTVKVELRRLAHSNIVAKDGAGYFTPRCELERHLDEELRINGQRECLPRIHDVHLTFKMENIKKLLNQPGLAKEFMTLTNYGLGDRGPASPKDDNALILGYTEVASLSPAEVVENIFNKASEASLSQLWKTDLDEGDEVKAISGGYQETLRYDEWKLIVQFYRTGTIKVIISNSEHPFDAIGLQNALHDIDGIFLARTGIHFLDIASFFHIEKVHVGSDVLKDREFSGISRFNCTIKQLDRWLFRTYEKVLGGQLYVRREACLERGSFESSHINSLLVLMEHEATPSYTDLAMYRYEKRLRSVENQTDRNGLDILTLKKRFGQICDSSGFSSTSLSGNPYRIKKNDSK